MNVPRPAADRWPRNTLAARHPAVAGVTLGFAAGLICGAILAGCAPDELRPLGSRPSPATSGESAAAAESDPILIPPGLDDAALKAGYVALFDGQTLYGWVGAPGTAAVDQGQLVLGPDAASDREVEDEHLIYRPFPLPFGGYQSAAVSGGTSHSHGGVFPIPKVAVPFRVPPLDPHVELPAVEPVEVDEEWLEDPDHWAMRQVSQHAAGGNDLHFTRYTYRPMCWATPTFGAVPGGEAKVRRDGDTLRLTSGPGYVVSEKKYGDFALQCEVKCHAAESNSGLFFRAMEPTVEAPANGYECQIQNTLGPGGRTDPDDYGDGFGTGAIFRRQPARYVNANDGAWFHLTLVCVGNRMATWVNGLQVTDFTDTRDPHENPRKGRRDEPGYLLLQAHDAGTDVSFRNFRIQTLEP